MLGTDWQELTMRLGLAAVLGVLLGLDRELRGHSAGIRTHALVSLSSAMIMISSLMLADDLRAQGTQSDPLRAIQGLSQAIGFIAGGLIFVKSGSVRNLTTAANVWVAAAIGIACGAGQFRLVVVGAGMAIVVLTLLRVCERWLPDDEGKNGDMGA